MFNEFIRKFEYEEDNSKRILTNPFVNEDGENESILEPWKMDPKLDEDVI